RYLGACAAYHSSEHLAGYGAGWRAYVAGAASAVFLFCAASCGDGECQIAFGRPGCRPGVPTIGAFCSRPDDAGVLYCADAAIPPRSDTGMCFIGRRKCSGICLAPAQAGGVLRKHCAAFGEDERQGHARAANDRNIESHWCRRSLLFAMERITGLVRQCSATSGAFADIIGFLADTD